MPKSANKGKQRLEAMKNRVAEMKARHATIMPPIQPTHGEALALAEAFIGEREAHQADEEIDFEELLESCYEVLEKMTGLPVDKDNERMPPKLLANGRWMTYTDQRTGEKYTPRPDWADKI